MALAKITGHVEMRPRSLLTAHEDYTTLLFVSPWAVEKPGQVRCQLPVLGPCMPGLPAWLGAAQAAALSGSVLARAWR